jgi:GMP synthase-like glutamine amidotransferase
MATCLVVQHVEPEGPYAIATALSAEHVAIDIRQVFAHDLLPDNLDGFDALVVMGGPMSAASDDHFPTRRAELALLAEALRRDLPILGVCLGAQLLAAAAGGHVFRGHGGLEVGWGSVTLVDTTTDALFGGLPEVLNVLHWHGDTYALPEDATRLASNDRYTEQAFRVGESAWGLQFHLEVDETAVRSFVAAFPEEVLAGGSTPDALNAETPDALAQLEYDRDRVLARFAEHVAHGATPASDGDLVELR